MSDKRYLGNIITPTPTAPTGPFQDGAAPGVWSLQEAFTYTKAGLWPTAGNVAPYAFNGIQAGYQRILITTLGNSVDWGSALGGDAGNTMAVSSSTRGIWAGGGIGTNVLQFITFSTSGSAADFGDMIFSKSGGAGFGNETRGLLAGGDGGPSNSIQYISIATAGNAIDFGDLSSNEFGDGGPGGFASPTRGVIAEAGNASNNGIDFVTIATTGNASNFGDLTGDVLRFNFCGASNATRGLFAGGWDRISTNYDIINFVTIASTGNTTDFGNLTVQRRQLAGSASSTRALFQGGSSGTIRNIVDYVEVASTGNATDFGDLIRNSFELAGCSNAHGGLS